MKEIGFLSKPHAGKNTLPCQRIWKSIGTLSRQTPILLLVPMVAPLQQDLLCIFPRIPASPLRSSVRLVGPSPTGDGVHKTVHPTLAAVQEWLLQCFDGAGGLCVMELKLPSRDLWIQGPTGLKAVLRRSASPKPTTVGAPSSKS